MTTHTPCPHHPNATVTVFLWDGRHHCVECVEAACPGLVEFAKGRDCLEDTTTFDKGVAQAELVKLTRRVCLVAQFVFIGILLFDFNLGLLMVGVGGFFIAFLFIILYFTTVLAPAKKTMPTVRVIDGVVSVFRTSLADGNVPATTFPLTEARWHLGVFREDTDLRDMPASPAIILQAPRKWKGVVPPSEINATGSTPEMIRIWQGFLRLAEVPEESTPSNARTLFYFGMFLSLWLGPSGLHLAWSQEMHGKGGAVLKGPVAVYVGCLFMMLSLGSFLMGLKGLKEMRKNKI